MASSFNIAESGIGSYRMLAILRWVMVVIFLAFGIQKFTPQSAHGIELYIKNSPFVWWLSIFGVRGEANILGVVELTTALFLVGGLFQSGLVGHRRSYGGGDSCHYLVVLLHDTGCCRMELFD